MDEDLRSHLRQNANFSATIDERTGIESYSETAPSGPPAKTAASIIDNLWVPFMERIVRLHDGRALLVALVAGSIKRGNSAMAERWGRDIPLYDEALAMLEYGPNPGPCWALRTGAEIGRNVARAKDHAARMLWAQIGAAGGLDAMLKREQERGDEYDAYK
jgi:hypothetical protein